MGSALNDETLPHQIGRHGVWPSLGQNAIYSFSHPDCLTPPGVGGPTLQAIGPSVSLPLAWQSSGLYSLT